MSEKIFPKNFIKLQRPPLINVVENQDGVVTIDSTKHDYKIGAATGTRSGTMTGTNTGTRSAAGTGTRTGTGTATGTARTAMLQNVSQPPSLTETSIESVEMTPDETQLGGDYEIAPADVQPELAAGLEAEEVSSLKILETDIDKPQYDASGKLMIERSGEPILKPESIKAHGALDSDSDLDIDGDVDSATDADSDSDSDLDIDPDVDTITKEGILIPKKGLKFKPPLAEPGTKGRRGSE